METLAQNRFLGHLAHQVEPVAQFVPIAQRIIRQKNPCLLLNSKPPAHTSDHHQYLRVLVDTTRQTRVVGVPPQVRLDKEIYDLRGASFSITVGS